VRFEVFKAVTILTFFKVRHHVDWLEEANISEKHSTSIFRAEDSTLL
jgi:hypothetical protein